MLETRLAKTLEKLEKHGNVEVKKLSEEFGVTEKTIRKDLNRMEEMELLKRVHGGAVLNIKRSEGSYTNNQVRNAYMRDKEQIAHAAFNYVRNAGADGHVLYLDASSTIYELSRYLKNLPHLTIITNDLNIVSNLNNMTSRLHVTGGTLTNDINRYFVGSDAVQMINNHQMSICFVGTSSLNANFGFMTHTNEDAQIKRAAISRSSTKICLTDHTKFNQVSFVKFAEAKDIDIIITDDKAPTEQIRAFEEQGVKVIIAQNTAQL